MFAKCPFPVGHLGLSKSTWLQHSPKVVHLGPKMAPTWPQDAPNWPRDGPDMVPRWPQNNQRHKGKTNVFAKCLFPVGHVGLSQPAWLQPSPKMVHLGPKVAPTWPQGGPSWPQNGSKAATLQALTRTATPRQMALEAAIGCHKSTGTI